MNHYTLKSLLFLFSFFFSFCVYSQPEDIKRLPAQENIKIIHSLEEKFGVKIFFDDALIEKTVLNTKASEMPTIEKALEALLNETEITFSKLQAESYILLPAAVIRSITEKHDTLLNASSSTIVIGNLSNYRKNKSAVISGLILDGKTEKPLPGAIVVVKNMDLGVASDEKGMFELLLKPGNYIVFISCIGYEDYNVPIKVLSSGDFSIEMFEKSIKLEEVSVYARRADKNVSGEQMSLIEIDRKLIKQLPLLTGEKDLIRSFSMMPGIKSTGEFGTGISVRGGGNDQNLFIIEETPLYNTSHVFGLISSVSPDIVSNVNLYKGFIPAEYGERASSVIDIQPKHGNEKQYRANGGIGLFSSRLAIEGPVLKNKISFLIAGRSSYSDWLLNKIPDVDLANSKAKFYDLYASMHAALSKKQRLFVMFYNSYDYFNYSNQLHYSNINNAGELKWVYSGSTVTNYSLALTFSENKIKKEDIERADTSYIHEHAISSLALRGDMVYNINQHNSLKTGFVAVKYGINPGEQRPYDANSSATTVSLGKNNGLETALYLSDNITVNTFISIYIGLRYSAFFNTGPSVIYNYQAGLPLSNATMLETTSYDDNDLIKFYHGPEPRLSIKYQFNSSMSTKISYSRNIQYISLISASAVQSPDDIWQVSGKYIKPIKSNAVAWGFYKNFKQNTFETSVELYYRYLKNLTEYKNGAKLSMNPHIETELLNATGNNYGIEILLKKNQGNIDGWISYTYSRSFRKTNGLYTEEIINNNKIYPSSFDKPHDLNLMLTYHYNRRLRFSANFTYSTGRAVTLPEAIYYTDNSWKVSYRDRNSERLPDYHRLDLSVSLDESLRLKKKWKGSWTFSVLNIYARKNAYSIFFKSEVPSKENNYRSFGLYKLYIIGRPLVTITYNFIF
jgi:hypothetical protein